MCFYLANGVTDENFFSLSDENITSLLVNNENYLFEEITFDEHVNTYIVYRKNETEFLRFLDLPTIMPLHSAIKNNTHYLVPKYGL